MPQAFRQDPETGEWIEFNPRSKRETVQQSGKVSVKRKELEEYAAVVDKLADTASESLRLVLIADLSSFDINMDEKKWKELREILIEDLYQARLYWSDASGVAACDFYDSIITNRDEKSSFNSAQLPEQTTRKECADCIRALARYLFEGNSQKFIDKVTENAHNGVRRYANETIMSNTKRDGVKGVRYARVPVGAETCAFCIMLASRGFVYYSKESAKGNGHVHPNCDCKIVPGFEGDVIEGYNPKAYLDIYAAGDKGGDMKDTINNIRREILYPVYGDRIREKKRDWWAKNKDKYNKNNANA